MKKKKTKKYVMLVMATLLMFMLTSCTPTAVNALDAAVAAAEVALPVVLAAANVDPTVSSSASAWLAAFVTVVDDLLAAPVTTASIDKAIADYEALGQPNVPPGNVANVLAGVTKAFKTFIDNYQGAAVTTSSIISFGPMVDGAFPQARHKTIKVDEQTRARLQAIRTRAQNVRKALGR